MQSKSQTQTKPKIAILGAGLMGRMLAVSLKDDYDIELFDQDSGDGQQSAAYLAAAMLAPLAESADATKPIMTLGQLALQRWPFFLKKLSEPVFFQKEGSLVLAFEQDLGNLRQFKSRLKGDEFEVVDSDRIAELEPEINERFKEGVFLPTEGQLDNRELLEALGKEIESSDVVWYHNAFISHTEEDGFLVNGEPLTDFMGEFEWIFDCRGFGAKSDTDLISPDGLSDEALSQRSLRGVRGEVIRVKAEDVKLNRPVRLMHPRYPIYITPKEKGVFVIGATQLESEDTREPTVRSALELLSACFSVHSGFAEAEILAILSGIRPAYLDNEPKIYIKDRVISVNGLFRHGYLLAPVMVEQCINILKGEHAASVISKIMPEMVQDLREGG